MRLVNLLVRCNPSQPCFCATAFEKLTARLVTIASGAIGRGARWATIHCRKAEGGKLRALPSFSSTAAVIDPCVGQGTALELVTGDAPIRCHGIELDAESARIAVLKASRPSRETFSTSLRSPNRSQCCTSIRSMTPRSAPFGIGVWRLCSSNTPAGCEWEAF